MIRNSSSSPRAGLRTAVIGAGIGGITMAVKLQKAGLTNFTVFEEAPGAGGTWFYNSYPGCEVDIPSYLYSFAFMPWDWPRTHGSQPELKQYVDATIDHFGVRDHFRFSTGIAEARWIDERSVYVLTLADGSQEEFDAVVSCVGLLSDPKIPDWPGLADFKGEMFHTSRWNHEYDFTGKNVAFVGTGSTAAQAVPAIAPLAEHLYLFQRQPGWVVPKGERAYTDKERARYRSSAVYRKWKRLSTFVYSERRFQALLSESRLNRKFRANALAFIDREIDDPELRAALTPDFPFGCKRTVQASTFYSTLNRPNVTTIPKAVAALTEDGVAAEGVPETKVDAVILGTGFQSQNFLSKLRVIGANGRDLHDVWGDTARAYLGSTVPGFPNFFMVYGPNTNGSSGFFMNDRNAGVAVRSLSRIKTSNTYIDTRPSAHERYVRWIDRKSDSALKNQRLCHNYFFSASGKNVTQYPASGLLHLIKCRVFPRFGLAVKRASPR